MATVRSVDFLPEIFQTDANKQFLAATLDQLIQEPQFAKTQGFVGRRVGPGVNPGDRYIVEPDATRANYQLEPGVVSLIPDTNRIGNVITYPGINDAIEYQQGSSSRPDRLYTSEYYSWDPFVDFDSFVNFSQYFWLPNGPDVVNVQASTIPVSQNYVVNRENGVYTFGGISGNNPVIELVRGGSYTFQVSQNNKETVNYRVRNSGIAAYVIDFQNNPALTLSRGNTYVFNLNTDGVFPFWIKSQPVTGLTETYSTGVTRNGAVTGLVTFTVPQDAPDTLYYIAENQGNMQGVLNIVDGVPGSGPGFWIQAAPGISGRLPTSNNISSRDVYGVENNGEDLGTIVFNVPYKTSQDFYYNLPSISNVDLVTTLQFDQINNQPLDQFIATYGGIDGITNLNSRTLIFTNTVPDAEAGGWVRTSFYDPLEASAANNGQIGSFDSTPYSETVEIPLSQRYDIWQINYVTLSGKTYINLANITPVNNLEKFKILYGTTYSNTQWFKDATGVYEQIPLLTAAQDVLYYQDGTDPEIFGRIKLIDQTASSTIFVDEIIGQQSYTSPKGVVFSNGLKIRFTGDVEPANYRSGSSSFTYIGTEAVTNYINLEEPTDLYVGQEIVFTAPTLGGLVAGTTYYVRSVSPIGAKFTVSTTIGGAAVQLQFGTGNSVAISISDREYYVAGVGTAIELLPVENFVVPETYVVDYNTGTQAAEPQELDYLTISRASKDLNPWTRSNRWFHIDVINATAEYNNTTATLDNNYRAKRPIIQFRPGIRLWNMGTQGKAAVDLIDFAETDAFSNIEGSTGYTVAGYTLVEGSRVIFAADEDADVRNKIYVVSFVTPDTVSPLIDQPIIVLTLADDGVVSTDQSTVVINSGTSTVPVPTNIGGKSYWYNGTDWIEAQQKTGVQQAPLYNIYDVEGVSFGDSTKYQSTTFTGSKLFSYAVGDTTILDPILQFPLQYLNINNVGDIVFENNLYKDTFLYVVDNVSVTSDISSGSVREYTDQLTYDKLLGWQTATVPSQIYQQFRFTYSGAPLKLDVAVDNQTTISVPVIKLYVGSVFQDPSTYSYATTNDSTTITLSSKVVLDSIIEVLVLSQQTSSVGFFQVPINLESNPLNANSPSFTLGTIRTHYQSICENLTTLTGVVNGANNTRDLGNIVPYGLTILQQSAPLTLAGYFMRSQDYNIFEAVQYNSREYIKYKAQMLDATIKQVINFQTPGQILDTAIQDITLGKVDSQPFYWSDMLPQGTVTYTTNYSVSFITTNVFDTVQVYNFTSANYLGLLVYLNNNLLTRGVDYTVATDGPRITIITALNVGDVVTINEYDLTYGSFVPNTPTKLGLYPAWQPEIVTQVTSNGEITAILGHDGSITPTFGDIRDDVLLEFETRIYNNLKLDGNPVPLTIDNVLPGNFRETGYSYQEISGILGTDFLSYCGWNKLDYNNQTYFANNEFTWNYSAAQNKLNNENLLGAWRGIYRYFYDTMQPSLTPWEMLGFSVEPTWWEERYGPAPYTSDNLVLWDDLEAGYVADPVLPYTRPEYARPGLTKVIPTGTSGELLSPFDSVVGTFDENQRQRSWAIGDGGPVEASWWSSSAYPFSVMRVLALTRPAKFFALFADRDLYRYNTDYNQYLYNSRYRLDANGIQVYGNGVSKASYINWIVDFNRLTGVNSTDTLTADLRSIDVRLCYRMASYSDKQYIKIYTEKSSPNSVNTALLIPDESYNLLVYKNQPFARTTYSSVAVQKTADGGYAVFGFGSTQPYFNILASRSAGRQQNISAGGTTVRVPIAHSNTVVQVPYGFVFSSETSVVDFLLSYGKFLETQGLTFDNVANAYILDWQRMAQEFLYWSGQGWGTDAIINLNPLAAGLRVYREKAVVDTIRSQTLNNGVLDQNSNEFPTRDLNIVRLGNEFRIQPLSAQAISYTDLSFTAYEHLIVMDNQSVFGDLIYDPTTGARQSRLNLVAVTTTDWNGSVNAPGFILNQDNVKEWSGSNTYSKGEIVKYKNVYWSALTIVQPGTKFNFNDWTQSDYEQIELGLLPNLPNKANQLQNSYNINVANVESDTDLLSYGLIGFRPRQYMAALNLDDVSQLNVYRQFLDSKGTIQATELFKGANLGKESADYDIYENWAVQQAVYGANANRSFIELRLNRALLNANPSLIEVTLPQQTTEADQNILLSDIWRQSYKLTSTNILPTTISTPTDTALPSAGYVNLDDADITVFDITDTASLAANIDEIEVGTSIWVAKTNDYDWNIYRAEPVPGIIQHVCDNLNGTSRVIFSAQHGLSAGDKLIIKFFDPEINGVYQVLSVASLNTVNISFQFTGDRSVANGIGLGFTLQTMRVAQASDIVNLPYAQNLAPGARVWVDNNGSELWEVLEKQDIFSTTQTLRPGVLNANDYYGQSVAQSQNRVSALVGVPRYGHDSGTETGAVFVYVRTAGEVYTLASPTQVNGDAILELAATGVRGYGNAIDFGNQTWAVAGASKSLGPSSQADNGYAAVIYRDPALGQPDTNPYAQWQLLTQPGTTPSTTPGAGEFGYSVAISQDERWMYIGAPGLNQVHAYGRVDWQNQFVRARGDDDTTVYAIDQAIQIDADTQLKVTVDGTVQVLGVGYTVDAGLTEVTFATAPTLGTLVDIQRIYIQPLDAQTYYDVTQTSTSGSGVGAKFTVIRIRNQVGQPGATQGGVGVTTAGSNYVVGNTVTFASSKFGGQANLVVTITSVDVNGGIVAFDIAYTPVSLTTVFDLGEYFFTVDNIYSFTVEVNSVIYRPNIDYTFNAGTTELTFVTVPVAGASIVVEAQSYFKYVNSITVPGLIAGARFGSSISCTSDGRQVLIGAPNQTVDSATEAGAVYVFDRNVQKFINTVTTANPVFTILGTPAAPISVLVNNQFYINQNDAIVAAADTFSWNGSTSVTINGSLAIGDVVEIETNQFALVQALEQNTLAEFSNFGYAVELCSYDCSLYVGEPNSSLQVYKGGVVERNVNQSRVYGTTTSLVANAVLTAGNTLRVNNIDVAVPDQWNSALTYATNRVVYNTVGSTTTIYLAIQAVPALTTITNATYWQQVAVTTVAASARVRALAAQINAIVPNVLSTVDTAGYLTVAVKNNVAATEFNKVQVSPGSVGTAFDTLSFETFVWTQTILSPYPTQFASFGSSISLDSSAISLVVGAPNGTLYLENIFDDGTTIFDIGSTIFFSIIVQSGSVYAYDYLSSATMNVNNPGKFVFGQQISDSTINSYDQFGTALNYTSGVLMIGAPGNDFNDSDAANYGTVYTYDNATRGAAWTTIQQQQPVVDIQLLNSVFLYDRVTSTTTEFLDFINPLQGKILGAARQNLNYVGAVDPASYNSGPTNIRGTTWTNEHVGELWWDTSAVRFIDPNQDSIVYAARRWAQLFPGSSVDVYQWIVSPTPPAQYAGEGTPRDFLSYTVNGRITVDGTIATEYYFWVRGITVTASSQGKTLPASVVANYIQDPRASGIAYLAPINASTVAIYNSGDYIEAQDTILHIEYDRELTTNNVHVEYELIPQDRGDGFLSDNLYRKLQDSFCGVDTFGNLVPDTNLGPAERYGVQFRPRQSMFVDRFEALRNYLTRANTVLAQYTISESRNFNLLNSQEPELPQTQLIDGVTITNWNQRVANLEILGFQDIDAIPLPSLPYRYLVATDANNRGLWTIYTVQLDDSGLDSRELVLTRVQNYYTPDYWSYIDWYRPGYNSSVRVIAEVVTYSALNSLLVPTGSSVKVTANSQGKWEIYLRTDLGWERVGLQDGTIEFSNQLWDYAAGRFGWDVEVFDAQYYDQEPVIETRKIIQAINEELFVDDLAIERNRALVLMFNYVLSEFSAPEWLVKTSLIDVDHRIRDLVPFQNYLRDNQEFVEDYIQEVKPYHVQIREFNLKYSGFDQYFGDVSDFDLPAYYDTTLEIPQYVSPILTPYESGTAFNAALNTKSNVPASSTIWKNWPYNQWYNNYLLELQDIEIIEGGSGYTEPPTVIVTGVALEEAEAIAIINSAGQVVGISVTNPGSGYSETPTITFDGGNGTGARAYAIMGNEVVRQFKTTLRYDRVQYVTNVLTWTANATYQDGTLVRYDNRIWKAASQDSTAVVSPTFDLENWELVNPASLQLTYNSQQGYYEVSSGTSYVTGVDRTMGLYVAGVNQPGLELPLLIDGIDYPGVQVFGDYFLGTTALDAVYQSEFTDTTLGTLPTDINVDGGKFLGVFEGHAPEELVNGSEFDTLDFRVYTRPGSDWSGDGHGFQVGTTRYTYEPAIISTYSWANIVENPVQVLVSNLTRGLDMYYDIDYFVNWGDQTIEIVSGATAGDTINISVYELGGGSQLFRAIYTGQDLGQTLTIPVSAAEIDQVVVFVNGSAITGVNWEPYIDSVAWSVLNTYDRNTIVNSAGNFYRALQSVPIGTALTNATYWLEFVPTLLTLVDFGTTFDPNDGVSIVALGITTPEQYSWSTPQVQVFVADSDIQTNKTLVLTNSVDGTNPANMIVTLNGARLQPAEGIEWIGDDSTLSFGLPQRGGYQQEIIDAITDIQVWVDNVLQTQSFGAFTGDFSVSNWDGSNTPGRQVVFNTAPAAGAQILISVDTIADYNVIGNQVQIVGTVNLGDKFAVTTWNDTAQQNILTSVFIGPVITGATIVEGYQDTAYDPNFVELVSSGTVPATAIKLGDTYTIVSVGTTNFVSFGAASNTVGVSFVATQDGTTTSGTGTTTGPVYSRSTATNAFNNTSGSFDYSVGTTVANNDFLLGRPGVLAGRLWVTLNGERQFEGVDYIVEGEYLILASGPIGLTDIMVITQFTDSVTPEAMEFRVFQDMRGVQATYRITNSTTTELAQTLGANDDVIYVTKVSSLSQPNLEDGIFGVITIDGERIMYRERDLANNTVSGLRRGTAGTAAAEHEVGALVYDIGRGNLLNIEYQDYIVKDTSIGDGSTAVFYAPSIQIDNPLEDSAIDTKAIEVYVGGTRQYPATANQFGDIIPCQYPWNVGQFDPLSIEFVVDGSAVPEQVAPPAGVEVTILVRRGKSWYQPGNGTASNGVSLQDTDTVAARFLRGE
jgi:hypothetical protein